MSEENPVFKVTDRRLFNSDGSPREVEVEQKDESSSEKTTESASAPEVQPAASASTPAPQSTGAGSAEQAERTNEVASIIGEASAPEAESDESDIPGADDPASFVNFLMSIASNAAAALGMMEHPVTGERKVNPEVGKHWIDVLGMLQKKTHGNLSPQEQQIFEGLLADLRMQYVSLSSAPQSKAQRGFSGSDITGGK